VRHLPGTTTTEFPVKIVIDSPPATKKNNSQIVRVRGRLILIPSRRYLRYERDALWQLRAIWQGRAPITGDVNCAALFYRNRASGDLNNYTAALADILEKAGIVANDRQIGGWDGSRLAKDAARPRVEMVLTPL
jgi:Holliday junction resolvase RusA-like endonuclease